MNYEQLMDPEVGLENNLNLNNHERDLEDSIVESSSQGVSQSRQQQSLLPTTLLTFLLFGLVTLLASPFEQPLTSQVLDDISLAAPYKPDSTVPYLFVLVVMIILPLIFFYYLMFSAGYVDGATPRSRWQLVLQEYLKYLLGMALLLLATEVPKMAVGRPRPDFLSRCKPVLHNSTVALNEWTCSGNASVIKEGRKSFPSGHSSSSFFVMSYLCLYYLIVYVPRNHKSHRLSDNTPRTSLISSTNKISPLALLMIVCAYLAASLVAISRLQDHKHHPTDVLAGSLLGISISYFVIKLIV